MQSPLAKIEQKMIDHLGDRLPELDSLFTGEVREPEKSSSGSNAIDSFADPIRIAEQDNTKAFNR